MSIKDADILELKDRYSFIIQEYAKLALELAPLLDKFGKYKRELEIITTEFVRRGFRPKDPEGFDKLIQEELDKRGIKADVGQQKIT